MTAEIGRRVKAGEEPMPTTGYFEPRERQMPEDSKPTIERPDDIVGHKTFQDGPMGFRHEPLTRAEAEVLVAAADAADKRRAEEMPDEEAAINKLFDAWLRLKELGWKEACHCPKDGSPFQIIEAGSTGVFDAHYSGEWPDGYIISVDGNDTYVSRPAGTILCRVGERRAR